MNEGLQFEWMISDELRALNLKGFECVLLIGKLMKEWWFSPSVLELNLRERKSNWKYGIDWEKREVVVDAIWNKKRWLIVAPFHNIFFAIWMMAIVTYLIKVLCKIYLCHHSFSVLSLSCQKKRWILSLIIFVFLSFAKFFLLFLNP